MKPSSVMRPRVKSDRRRARPSRPSTSPSGARMIRCSVYVPGRGGSKSSDGSGAASWATTAGAAASHTVSAAIVARRRFPIIEGLGHSPARAKRLGAELHVVGAPEVLFREVHLEGRLQLLAVPGEAAQELLVVGAALVPVGEQRRRDVHALAVPALGDHVDLLAGDLRVRLLRGLRLRQIEIARGAV